MAATDTHALIGFQYVSPSKKVWQERSQLPSHNPKEDGAISLLVDRQLSPDSWNDELKTCHDLTSMRGLRAQYLFWVEDQSHQAFEQLLRSGSPIADVLAFLDDPSMNDPRAFNFQQLMRWMAKTASLDSLKDQAQIDAIAAWIRVNLSMGKLMEDEIGSSIRLLHHLSSQSDTLAASRLGDAIVGGLAGCPVLRFSDLAHPLIHELLRSLNRIIFASTSEEPRSTMFRLLEVLDHSHIRSSYSEIALFLLRSIHIVDIRGRDAGSSQSDILRVVDAEFSQVLSKVRETSQSGKQDVNHLEGLFISMATRKLLTGHLNLPLESRARLCDQWFCLLARKTLIANLWKSEYNVNVGNLISKQPGTIIACLLRHQDERELCHFALSHWCDNPRLAHGKFAEYSRICKASLLTNTVMTAHSVNQLPDSFDSKFIDLLRALHRFRDITCIVQRARIYKYHIAASTLLTTVRESLSASSRHARAIFMSDPRLLLESCPELAEDVILNHPRPENVWALHRNRSISCRQAAFGNNLSKWQRARASLLARMAKAFSSIATEQNHDKFYWHVNGCWVVHVRERLGPLDPLMSRALLWTGVMLPLRDKKIVNEVRVHKILEAIKEAEGEAIADAIARDVYRWRGDVITYLGQMGNSGSYSQRAVLPRKPPWNEI